MWASDTSSLAVVMPRVLLDFLCHLSSLQIERSLILEPSPVIADTSDLLAVIIGYRIRDGRSARIDSVLLDSVVELALPLCELSASHSAKPTSLIR